MLHTISQVRSSLHQWDDDWQLPIIYVYTFTSTWTALLPSQPVLRQLVLVERSLIHAVVWIKPTQVLPYPEVHLSDLPQVGLKTDTCQSKLLVYLVIWPFQANQDSLKNNKSQRLEITQTWLKLSPVHFPFSLGWDPSWVSGRVSLRSSSYTPHFHKNAARSAYQSQLLIKELLYSCWRHIRREVRSRPFLPVLMAIWKANEGGDHSRDVVCMFEKHLKGFLAVKHSNVCSQVCVKKRQRMFAIICWKLFLKTWSIMKIKKLWELFHLLFCVNSNKNKNKYSMTNMKHNLQNVVFTK